MKPWQKKVIWYILFFGGYGITWYFYGAKLVIALCALALCRNLRDKYNW